MRGTTDLGGTQEYILRYAGRLGYGLATGRSYLLAEFLGTKGSTVTLSTGLLLIAGPAVAARR